ncbi:hypothetical protein DUNSADRAFT_9717 [Dunaliella salina]|uniref:Uncharacterized protein n=1 Tax=Dunaliella salina TaxID=3046 RepID=A0ABQ7GGW7_DUNSA|nr:hypothetical protein DUNSADRAFT_9717 [Dunaliella salina]|eukprot:KAF5833843.1 hypothetical protein DUNSADRAFT_9717 [Dunaliella salina]
MGYSAVLRTVLPVLCIVLAAGISHPHDFLESASLQLVSIKSPNTQNPGNQQLISAYVHPQHAHMQGYCFEVHSEEAALRMQGAVAVQGAIPDTAAIDRPNHTSNAPTFHVILPKMSRHELVSVPMDVVITAQLPILFRPVSCKSAADTLKSALSPGHAAGGGKCSSANECEDLTAEEKAREFPKDEAATAAVAFLYAVYNHTASGGLGRVVASLHQLAILEEVGQEAKGSAKSLEVPQKHRSLASDQNGNTSGGSSSTGEEGQSTAAIFVDDFLQPGWKDVATKDARPLHENGVDGEGRAYCKYLPKGTQISATWQPDNNSAGSPFVGKRKLEFWLRVRSVEDPEPLEIILSGKDKDCKNVNTGELQPTEIKRNWAKYDINLSEFDARQQTLEGDVLVQCSDRLGALDIRSISWALPNSLMGSTVCLDDVKLV